METNTKLNIFAYAPEAPEDGRYRLYEVQTGEPVAYAVDQRQATHLAACLNVCADVPPVVLVAWHLQGRQVGRERDAAQAAIIGLQEQRNALVAAVRQAIPRCDAQTAQALRAVLEEVTQAPV